MEKIKTKDINLQPGLERCDGCLRSTVLSSLSDIKQIVSHRIPELGQKPDRPFV